MINEILKVAYPNLKIVKNGNFKSIEDDLNLLGIEYSEEDLIKAFAIASSSNSIDEALSTVDNIDSEAIVKVKTRMESEKKAEKIKQEKIKQEKVEKNKLQERKKLIKEQANASNYLKAISGYKVIGAKDEWSLDSKVTNAMKSGWIPYGGLSTYNPGGKLGGVPNSFFQAMVKF
tara:strand:- start:1930 stop:2454 length:525 start_codon:yes stop_codon:yes gene_type:complete